MQEENLIFLISQPRAGSTLTQKILGAHTKVYTRSEPWIMFPSAYSLKFEGAWAEYDFKGASTAIKDFAIHLPGGEEGYLNALKHMHLQLYGAYATANNAEYFLDKTPRYYLIYDELKKIFPKAKYIILIRNPLAVLSSILNTWIKTDYHKLSDHTYDLFAAVERLVDIIESDEGCAKIIQYEELLKNPTKIVSELCGFADMTFEPEMLSEYAKNQEKMLYGDPENVYKFQGIQSDNDHQWIEGLKDPQQWRFIYDYLSWIGEDRFKKLGYDFSEAMKIVQTYQPANIQSYLSLSDATGEKRRMSIEAAKGYGRLYEQIMALSETSERYVVYGYGTVGKTIRALIPEKVTAFVDLKCSGIPQEENVFLPTRLGEMAYDKIIISVLGREEGIEHYLVNEIGVPKEKIVRFAV